MSFRVVVITKSAKLDLKLNHLVIRDSEVKKVHLSEIAVLIVENTAISITAALLCELVKQKIRVIFCDEKRNPISELCPYYGSHDTSLKVSSQTKWEEQTKGEVWTEIVSLKIEKQKGLLQKLGLVECELLDGYLKQIEFNDATNREGHAAKVYFNALFGKSFSRDSMNNTNAALNYGYSIILSAFNREISACGYITQLGISHCNMYNQFNLACDLMEPFRPIIDEEVVNMQLEQFDKEEKMQLVNVLNKEFIIAGKKQYMLNTIRIYLRSIFDRLNNNGQGNILVYGNEL